MRKISRAAQRLAREEEAVMFRARVPAGSLSHLSGKRFAAPVAVSRVLQAEVVRRRAYSEQQPEVFSSNLSACTAAYVTRRVTHLASSRTASTEAEELRSSLMIEGGFARVNPVPTTSNPCLWNALTTCLPSRPVAPVIRAVFVMMVA